MDIRQPARDLWTAYVQARARYITSRTRFIALLQDSVSGETGRLTRDVHLAAASAKANEAFAASSRAYNAYLGQRL